MTAIRTSTATWKQIRRATLTRDNFTCLKCGRRNALQAHHIIAVAQGGGGELENLATLCAGCHAEWDMIDTITDIQWTAWLLLPSAASLVAVFAQPERWTANVSALAFRAAWIDAAQAMKNIHSSMPLEDEEEGE